MRIAAIAGAVSLLTPLASADLIVFNAVDHPDGGVDNQQYGLRLDNFGPDNQVTFTFEVGGSSSMVITIDTDANTLNLSGAISGNSAVSGTQLGTYFLNVTIAGTWNDATQQFISTTASTDIGTLTASGDVTGDSPLAANESMTLGSQARGNGDVFLFGLGLPGSRLPNGDTRYEGFGWVNSGLSSGTEDFLFAATRQPIIPAPASTALLGLGGLVMTRRRRAS